MHLRSLGTETTEKGPLPSGTGLSALRASTPGLLVMAVCTYTVDTALCDHRAAVEVFGTAAKPNPLLSASQSGVCLIARAGSPASASTLRDLSAGTSPLLASVPECSAAQRRIWTR